MRSCIYDKRYLEYLILSANLLLVKKYMKTRLIFHVIYFIFILSYIFM
jgi:hypothetical protein